MSPNLGVLHFIAQADRLSQVLLAVLLSMSLASWYLIIRKTYANRRLRRRATTFQSFFWQAPDRQAISNYLAKQGVGDPFSHLAHHGLRAAEHYASASSQRPIAPVSADEFFTRALRRAIEQDTARLEYGHTLLASVASAAPFVGLFGTVWGIYQAMMAISASAQSTIDKIAGPVGEALIMTAFGIAVAIPAVLAYNAFVRANRLLLSELDGFAHDVFAYLSMGHRPVASLVSPSKTGGA